jgi:hypothetical protein
MPLSSCEFYVKINAVKAINEIVHIFVLSYLNKIDTGDAHNNLLSD